MPINQSSYLWTEDQSFHQLTPEEICKRYPPEILTVDYNIVSDSQGQRLINGEPTFTAVTNNKHGVKIGDLQVDLREKWKVTIAQHKDEIVIQVGDNLYIKKSWSTEIEWIDPWEEYSKLRVNDRVFKKTWKLFAVWWKYNNRDRVSDKVYVENQMYYSDIMTDVWSSWNMVMDETKIDSSWSNWEWCIYEFDKISKTITKKSDYKLSYNDRLETNDKRVISMTKDNDEVSITETDISWIKKEWTNKIDARSWNIPKLTNNWNTVLVYSDKEIVINDDSFQLNNFGWRYIEQVKTSPDGKKLIILSKNYQTKEVFLSLANRQTSQDDNEQGLFWIIKEVKLEKNDTGQIAISDDWDFGYASNIQKKLFINEEIIDLEISRDPSTILEFDFIDEWKLNIKYIDENDITKHYHFPCREVLNEVDYAQKILKEQEEINRKLINKVNESDINTPEEFDKLQDTAKKFVDIVKNNQELERELAQLRLENIDLKNQNEELIIQQDADSSKLDTLRIKLAQSIKSITKSFWRQVISDAEKSNLEELSEELKKILPSEPKK